MPTLKLNTTSEAETIALGAAVGRLAAPGDFISLVGDLGAGKTQFAKGVAAGLGVDPETPVTSPTYTILNIYEGRLPLYHFDLYRLQDAEEVADLGFEEYFYGKGVCVVEWAERLDGQVPEQFLTVSLQHLDDEGRSITFLPSGERPTALVRELAVFWPVGGNLCMRSG